MAAIIKEQFDLMNVSYDHFIRTTDDYHEKRQKIFKYLYDKGISTRAPTRACTAPARASGLRASSSTASAPTAAGGPPAARRSLLLQDEQVRPG